MYKIVVEIPEGWGGYFSGQKLEIPGRSPGGLREIPSVVGVWIFSGTTHLELICTSEFFKKLKLHEPLQRVQFCFLKNSQVQINSKLNEKNRMITY